MQVTANGLFTPEQVETQIEAFEAGNTRFSELTAILFEKPNEAEPSPRRVV